ncbi:putative cytochrome c1 [Lupinus albus]|uniref:Putative cytochrome c1 n=1 Tax=Lupinus albus TaxID=3870 RepID=A0A6A4QG78_LUPAL|nr:putative cytochrome c1 [Lupinus albus]
MHIFYEFWKNEIHFPLLVLLQMGKDVVSFLTWAAEPEMEERKLMGFKWIFVLSLALLQAAYYRRLRWSVLKSRKLVLDVVN